MHKKYSPALWFAAVAALVFLTGALPVAAEVSPAPGAKLNYTQVMFEYEKISGVQEYVVELSSPNRTGDAGQVVLTQRDTTTATLVNGLQFGKKYVWRYAGVKDGKQLDWKGPYNFEILNDSLVLKNRVRVRVIKNEMTRNSPGGLLLLDYARIAVTRTGEPVWFLPSAQFSDLKRSVTRDLRLNTGGTFTFVTDSAAYESDLNGNLLWRAPNDGKVSGAKSEFYHHDFQKLPTGNYMVLGQAYTSRTVPASYDVSKFKKENIENDNGVLKVKMMFGTIIEYDRTGKVVWSWNSGSYFKDADIFNSEVATNNPRRTSSAEVANAELYGHLNSFDVDEKGEYVYAGFRDVSRIVKIEKKTGKVVQSWGASMPSGEATEGNGFFKNQHGSCILKNGNIATFNNNGMNDFNNTSNLVVFSQPEAKKRSEIKWQFDCHFDTITSGKSSRNGNMEQLPNGNFIASMGGVNRLVEVNANTKKVVWDAFVESVPLGAPSWMQYPQYRVHYASSLYPGYFTLDAGPSVLTIYNEGTDPDSYNVQLKSSAGKNLVTPLVLPGQSYKVETGSVKVEAQVASVSNPSASRKITVPAK